jgi:hypothetical protein
MGTQDSTETQTGLSAFNAAFGESDPESIFAQPGSTAGADGSNQVDSDQTDQADGLPDDPVARMRALEERILQVAQANAELTQQVRSATGRIGAMQRELETRRKAAPAPQAQAQTPAPPAPRLEKFEAVRSELPDVADGLAQYVDAQLEKLKPAAPPEPQRQEVTASMHGGSDEAALYEAFPAWEATVTRPEFDLWLQTKGPEYMQRIKRTESHAEMMSALVQYQAHTSQSTQPQHNVSQQRSLRVQQAVQPNTPAVRASRTPAVSGQQAFDEAFANER